MGVILIGLLGLALSYISLNIVELRPYWGINIFPAMFFLWSRVLSKTNSV